MADNNRTTPRTDGPRRFGAEEYDPERLIPPRSGSRPIIVGAFVLAGIVATLVALFSLTDPALFRGRYNIYTVVPNAGGLRKGDPVQLRGVNVGRVTRFEIQPGGVAVKLELEGEYHVPKDSRVALASSGLLGGMTAMIQPGNSTEVLEEGDTIPGSTEAGAFDVAATVGERADTLLARAQTLLSPQTIQNLGASTQALRDMLAETSALVAEDRANLRALTRSLAATAADLEAAKPGQQLAQTNARIAALTARLDSTAVQLGTAARALAASTSSLQVVLGRMERGEGTLGKLSRDEALYANLNMAVENMNRLAQDIRENPGRYINLKVF
ncbi:MAG: MCE family protein [Gemmatimonadetes bacterium]|nr:MCE family protein [Gemmatimonadota bacterium]